MTSYYPIWILFVGNTSQLFVGDFHVVNLLPSYKNPTNGINGFPHVSCFFVPRKNRAPRPCGGRGFRRNFPMPWNAATLFCLHPKDTESTCEATLRSTVPCVNSAVFLKKNITRDKNWEVYWEDWNCYGILLKVFFCPWLKNLESMCYKGFTIGVFKAHISTTIERAHLLTRGNKHGNVLCTLIGSLRVSENSRTQGALVSVEERRSKDCSMTAL